jgi:hypothetical protein
VIIKARLKRVALLSGWFREGHELLVPQFVQMGPRFSA